MADLIGCPIKGWFLHYYTRIGGASDGTFGAVTVTAMAFCQMFLALSPAALPQKAEQSEDGIVQSFVARHLRRLWFVCGMMAFLAVAVAGLDVAQRKGGFRRNAGISIVVEEDLLRIRHVEVVQLDLKMVGKGVKMQNRQRHPIYAICKSRWSGLSVVDLALLSELAYFPASDVPSVLPHFFPNREFQLRSVGEEMIKAGNWMEFYSPELNVSVIAIRGTDVLSFSDFVADAHLWVEVSRVKSVAMDGMRIEISFLLCFAVFLGQISAFLTRSHTVCSS